MVIQSLINYNSLAPALLCSVYKKIKPIADDSMEMEIEQAVGTALPTLASMLGMPIIPHGISHRMLITAISPLEQGGYYYGNRGFGGAVFPASAAAVAGQLEKHKFNLSPEVETTAAVPAAVASAWRSSRTGKS